MSRLALVLVAASLAALAGCSHSHQFTQDPSIGRLGEHPLAGKQVFLDLEGVPEEYRTSANGHSFNVSGIRSSVRTILTKMFGDDQIAKSLPGDARLDVDLSFDMGGTLFGVSATCQATCTIRDGDGNELATGTGTGEGSAGTMGNGGRNCEIAMLQAMPQALDAAFAKL
jgi:hypothetical protein